MTVKNDSTLPRAWLTHDGMFRTRIERHDDGSLVIVQVSKDGKTDCVILPPVLVGHLPRLLPSAKKRKSA